jgi:osmotically inducible protein OsmC
MAVTSSASTLWNGGLADGSGTTTLASGIETAVSWKARTEGSGQTTPEELIAAAHASCFSMALSHALGEAGHAPSSISTNAEVGFVPGQGITGSTLTVTATVPGLDQAEFERIANEAKNGCPVSQALAGIEITLASATLEG